PNDDNHIKHETDREKGNTKAEKGDHGERCRSEEAGKGKNQSQKRRRQCIYHQFRHRSSFLLRGVNWTVTIRAAKLVAPDLVHDLRMRRIILKICCFAVTLQAIFVGKRLIQLNGQMHANLGVESDYVSHAIQFRVDWPQKRVVGVATVALIIENKP